MQDRTITLFIMESKKNLKTAELSNWNGKAYIGERNQVNILQSIEELNAPAIYFLLNDPQEEKNNENYLYIGESDNVAKRLRVHSNPKEDWWNSFIAFIAPGLDKAHVQHLESLLFRLAKNNSEFFTLKNSQPPNKSSKLSESKIAEIKCFMGNMIFVLNNLGLIDFVKTASDVSQAPTTKEDVFWLPLVGSKKDANDNLLCAKMIISDSNYILLKDSYIETTIRESFKDSAYYKKRLKLENDGYFEKVKGMDVLKVKKDVYLKSPSAASSIVRCRPTNGRLEWKLENGTTLADFELKNI